MKCKICKFAYRYLRKRKDNLWFLWCCPIYCLTEVGHLKAMKLIVLCQPSFISWSFLYLSVSPCLNGGKTKRHTLLVAVVQIIFGNRWRHLVGERDFWEHVGGIDIYLTPSSFGQANTRVWFCKFWVFCWWMILSNLCIIQLHWHLLNIVVPLVMY